MGTLRAQEMQHQQYRFVLCVIGPVAVVTASGGHKGKAKGKMPHATACKGKSVADRCSFTGKEGTAIQGICMKMQGQLVCGTASGKAKGKRDCHGKAKGKSGENQHHGIPSQAQGHSQLSQGAMGTSKDTRMAGMVTGESTKASLGCQLSSSVSGSWPWWQPVWWQQRCSVVILRSRKSISRQLLLCAALLQQDRSSMYRRKTQ